MEKTINEIREILDSMAEDVDKFSNKGQNAAGTRIRSTGASAR